MSSSNVGGADAGIPWIDSLPGQTVFVKTDDPTRFRIGTVEALSEESCDISYEEPGAARREQAAIVPRSLIIEPREIPEIGEGDLIHVAGRLLAHPLTPPFMEIIQVAEDRAESSVTFRARRLQLTEQGWQPASDIFELPLNDAHPPLHLARIQTWRYHQAVDPYFDVIATPVGAVGDIEGEAVLDVSGTQVPLQTRLLANGLRGVIGATAHQSLASALLDLDPRLIVNRKMHSKTAQPPWSARFVSVAGGGLSWSIDGGAAPGRVDLSAASIDVSVVPGTAVFTREVFEGITIRAFTDAIARREPPLRMMPQLPPALDSIRTTLFGRSAMIYVPPYVQEAKEPLLAVLHSGEPLPSAEGRALASFIEYICGGRAGHPLTERFDVYRKMSVQFTDRGAPSTRMSPPVPLDSPTPHAKFIVAHSLVVLEGFARVYRRRDARGKLAARRLDAILHHYAEGVASSYSATRILRVAVAFETLVNLVTEDSASNEPLVGRKAFQKLRKEFEHILNATDDEGSPLLDKLERERFSRKFENFNQGSNTKRIARFWDMTKVSRRASDDELLRRLRNDSVHEGFVGDEVTRRSMLKTHREANRLVDLFNRAFLAYFGYRGPVRSTDGRRWLHARSGRLFRPPALLPAQQVELHITTTVGPLNSGEKVALDQIRSLRRRSAGRTIT